MSLVRNAYAVPLLLTALAVLVLAVSAWTRRRQAPGAGALGALSLVAAVWALCVALWLAADAAAAGKPLFEAQRAVAAVMALALLVYALRTTQLLAGVEAVLSWTATVLTAGVVVLAFGPVGGASLWRALETARVLRGPVTLGVPGVWGEAASALSAVMVAGAVALLLLAWLRAGPSTDARRGWTLLGVAMPVVAEAVAAILRGRPQAGGISPGAFLLAPAALAAAQGLFGSERAPPRRRPLWAAPTTGEAPRGLLDELDQPVLFVGPDGAVSYANSAAARQLQPVEGLAGVPAATVFRDHPELTAAIGGRRRAVLELELWRGSLSRTFEAWLTPLFQRSGHFAGTVVTFLDVTARREAEAERDTAVAGVRRGEALMEGLHDALRGALRGESLTWLVGNVVTGAAGALGAPNAALYLADTSGERLQRWAAVGAFEAVEEPPHLRGEGLVGRVWASARTHAVEALPRPGSAGQGASAEWTGTAIGVPLSDRGEAFGVLVVARDRGEWGSFDADETRVLERFADLAAVAARDASARGRAEHDTQQLTWLDRIDALTAGDAPDTEVLDMVLRAAREAAGFDHVVVWLATEDGDELEARAWMGFPQGPEGSERWPLDGSVPLLEVVFRSGEEMVQADGGPLPPRFRLSGSAADAPLLQFTRPAVLPLLAGGQVLGVLAADDLRGGAELDARLTALRRVAARAAQALDRTRARAVAACLRERLQDTEARLEAAFTRREAVISALPGAYFETDLAGVVTRASTELARLAGTAADGLRGVRLADLSAPEAERTLPDVMGRVLRSGRSVRGIGWALRLRSGEVLRVTVSVAVLLDEQGRPAGYFGTLVPRPE